MMRALWTAGTGMNAQQTNLDVIANNIANVNTVGFKRSRADFQDLIYQTLRLQGTKSEVGNQIPTGIQVGHGVMLAAVQKVFQQGDFSQTENEKDIAIEGKGFLQITMPDGTLAYTRAGSLKKDSDGRLCTSDGYLLTPNITVPTNTTVLSIGSDGIVSVETSGSTSATQIGKIELATFANDTGLKAIGKSLFQQTDASGVPTTGTPGTNGIGTLLQGYLEMSNVSIMTEMVNLIIGQRAYEVNSKAIQAADEMLQVANNLKK
jgi:flagellar basal-body rod protein FlgG